MAFVRAWANRDDGMSGTGKRVDAVIWAYGVGTVEHPLLLSEDAQSTLRSKRAGVEAMTLEEEEKARFLFFTAFLPQILHAVQTSAIKSLRLVSLLDPIYPAGFRTSPLLVPVPTSDDSTIPSPPSESPADETTTPAPAAPAKKVTPPSDAVRRAHHAMRTIVFTSHFQRILNALSSKSEALSDIPLPSAESSQGPSKDSEESKEGEKAHVEREARRSTILVTAVSPAWHFSSVLRPFLFNHSPRSLVIPTLSVCSFNCSLSDSGTTLTPQFCFLSPAGTLPCPSDLLSAPRHASAFRASCSPSLHHRRLWDGAAS